MNSTILSFYLACRYADYEVDLGFCNCAVDSEGVILPVSKMSGLQMAAELESRGVGTEGMPRPELAREIRVMLCDPLLWFGCSPASRAAS